MLNILKSGALALLILPLTGEGQPIYKCERAGVLVFSDEACGDDAEQLQMEDLQSRISIVEFVRGNYDPDAWKTRYLNSAVPESAVATPGYHARAPASRVEYVNIGQPPVRPAYYAPPGFGFYPALEPYQGPDKDNPRPAEPEPAPPLRKDLRNPVVTPSPSPRPRHNAGSQLKSRSVSANDNLTAGPSEPD